MKTYSPGLMKQQPIFGVKNCYENGFYSESMTVVNAKLFMCFN